MGSKAPPPQPQAPDPYATAQAQGEMNRKTAIQNQYLNSTNQRTPYGALTYRQTGTWADGTPRFEAEQTLSPEQQRLYDQSSANQYKLGSLGGRQIDRVDELLARPVNLSNEATEARLMDLGRKRLDPRFAEEEDALRTRLANMGLTMGSEAYTKELDRFGRGKNDAYNELLLRGRGQSVQEALTERNQPLNEITALMSGSQVTQPNFTTTPQTQVGGVDYSGMVQSNYGQAMNQYNRNLDRSSADRNAMLGGIFGLAAAPFAGFGMGMAKNNRLWG
jgi:hypothetical protein